MPGTSTGMHAWGMPCFACSGTHGMRLRSRPKLDGMKRFTPAFLAAFSSKNCDSMALCWWPTAEMTMSMPALSAPCISEPWMQKGDKAKSRM